MGGGSTAGPRTLAVDNAERAGRHCCRLRTAHLPAYPAPRVLPRPCRIPLAIPCPVLPAPCCPLYFLHHCTTHIHTACRGRRCSAPPLSLQTNSAALLSSPRCISSRSHVAPAGLHVTQKAGSAYILGWNGRVKWWSNVSPTPTRHPLHRSASSDVSPKLHSSPTQSAKW